MDKSKSSTMLSFFSESLPPALLEEILERIHENVYLYPLISGQLKPGEPHRYQFDDVPPLPAPPNFLELLNEIRSAQAPYYVVSGNFLSRFIKRIHNLVIKLFGRKQAYFNHLTLDLVESMSAYIHAMQGHSKAQASQIEALAREVMLQSEQFTVLQKDYQKMQFKIEQITARQDAEGQELEDQGK